MEVNSGSSVISKNIISFLSICVVLLSIALYMQGRWYTQKGELADPDCYTRLNRVVQLHESGKWYDSNNPRSNAPYGENLHLTRPFDVLLLTGASLATPLAGFKDSLFWWGVLISPFLLIASLLIIPWTFRPILSDDDSNLMRLLFISQLGILSYYSVARPDHHSLLGFTFMVSIGLILRVIPGSLNKTICYMAGMAGAFSLWVHVESLLLIFLIILLLGLFWIFDDDDDFVRKNLHYTAALFIFTGAALILERPWHDLTKIEYDKISLVHLFILGLISLFWSVVFSLRNSPVFSQQGRGWRFTIAFLGAVIVGLCVWLLFPAFFRGGYADIDPRIVPIWLSKIEEVQSPLRLDFLRALIQLLCSAMVGIAYIFFSFWKEPDKNMKGWIFILSGILLFALPGILERRLLLYGNIITVVPLAALLGGILRWETRHVKPLFRTLILSFTVISFCAAFLLPDYIYEKMVVKEKVSMQNERKASLADLCDELNFPLNDGSATKHRILAFVFYGPEILYRTDYEVIATPHHRNAQGILDTYRIMTAASDEKAYALIHRRGIDMILVTKDPGEREYYSSAPQGSIFYDHLKEESYPAWLRPVELPPILSTSYRLFRVTG
ncbi:MAG: hypothetical protein CVU55_03400 [Deltaproteobacteria bacterium HGW-Deltaproteobacteria-13]|jgi:hypothetical protein|nr:MAG: hypothetical protein CVU55_03400 [Deltaproteobacteria bacterium HGW-Deltaproteobacteria-13]